MQTTSSPSIRILLVDDHRTVLWGLERLIQSAEPHVRVVATASSGAQALSEASKHDPDVILLDLDLGEDNGLDLLPTLQATSSAKVLILSGTRDPQLRESAMQGGARGMVHKTEAAETILRAIDCVNSGEIWLDRAATGKLISALQGASAAREKDPATLAVTSLTRKEREVIYAVVQHKGAANKIIAGALCISAHTLRNHLASIYSKLSVHSRIDLFMFAKENGLDRPLS